MTTQDNELYEKLFVHIFLERPDWKFVETSVLQSPSVLQVKGDNFADYTLLHGVCSCPRAPFNIMKLFVRLYPAALLEVDEWGRKPLDCACHYIGDSSRTLCWLEAREEEEREKVKNSIDVQSRKGEPEASTKHKQKVEERIGQQPTQGQVVFRRRSRRLAGTDP